MIFGLWSYKISGSHCSASWLSEILGFEIFWFDWKQYLITQCFLGSFRYNHHSWLSKQYLELIMNQILTKCPNIFVSEKSACIA